MLWKLSIPSVMKGQPVKHAACPAAAPCMSHLPSPTSMVLDIQCTHLKCLHSSTPEKRHLLLDTCRNAVFSVPCGHMVTSMRQECPALQFCCDLQQLLRTLRHPLSQHLHHIAWSLRMMHWRQCPPGSASTSGDADLAHLSPPGLIGGFVDTRTSDQACKALCESQKVTLKLSCCHALKS